MSVRARMLTIAGMGSVLLLTVAVVLTIEMLALLSDEDEGDDEDAES